MLNGSADGSHTESHKGGGGTPKQQHSQARQRYRAFCDVIIIGGGVIGLACAHFLQATGMQVIILEKDSIGSGASHANCGLVYTSDILPLCAPGAVTSEILRMIKGSSPLSIEPRLDIARLGWFLRFAAKCNRWHLQAAMRARASALNSSMELYTHLLSKTGLECEWQRKGLLIVFRDQTRFHNYQRTNNLLIPYGMDAEPVLGKDLFRLEPALGGDVYGAWFHRSEAHLRPDLLLESWQGFLKTRKVRIFENCKVEGFEKAGEKITAITTNKGRFLAASCVVAAGAWSRGLLKGLGVNLPVEPAKGYSLTMQRPVKCPGLPCYLFESNVVATPWPSCFRLGGTLEFAGFDLSLNPRRLANLKKAARLYLRDPLGPRLKEQWVSVRPMTPDDLPVIGRAPGWENLFLATGHGMLGISMAPATGKLIAELVGEQRPHIDPEPFSAKRFRTFY